MDAKRVEDMYYTSLTFLNADRLSKTIKQKVIGQDAFVDEFVSFLCLALKSRVELISGADENDVPRLASAFIVGPTASGKTHVLKTICKTIGIDCQFIDCASLTGAGWRGNSVDTQLRNVAQTQKRYPGIITLIVWDEADKMRLNERISADYSFNPQHTLLKPLDGGIYQIESNRNTIETVNMNYVIHVFAGAFTGIEDIVAKRLQAGKASLGFMGEVACTPSAENTARLRQNIQVEDFVTWGMMPELCGRCGAIFNMPALSAEDLALIVKGSQFSLESKFARLAPGICNFELDDEATNLIVQKAQKTNLGVRALENILAPVAGRAIQAAQKELAHKIYIEVKDGDLSYRLDFMSEKRTQTHDDMNIPCSNTHESPNQVPSSAGIDERKISYISRALDRTCARFDLEYFMSTNDGITAISSLLSSQIVDLDDVVIRTAYKSERVAFIINALIRSTRFRCEGYCSVGTLYREACLASTPKTYFAEFTNRALYLDETEGDIRNAEWNTMVKVIRRAQDVAQEDFGALAEEIAQYLYTLLDEDCFNQLKTSIYKRFTPVNVRREQNVADDKELRAS